MVGGWRAWWEGGMGGWDGRVEGVWEGGGWDGRVGWEGGERVGGWRVGWEGGMGGWRACGRVEGGMGGWRACGRVEGVWEGGGRGDVEVCGGPGNEGHIRVLPVVPLVPGAAVA